MKKVFLDKFALIAFVNSLDAAHKRVAEYFATFRGVFVTTEWVLLEFADAFSGSQSRGSAVSTTRRLRGSSIFEILPYDPALYQSGFDLYSKRPDKDWSLTDCISFSAMENLGLFEALTADHHFEQAGYRAVFKV